MRYKPCFVFTSNIFYMMHVLTHRTNEVVFLLIIIKVVQYALLPKKTAKSILQKEFLLSEKMAVFLLLANLKEFRSLKLLLKLVGIIFLRIKFWLLKKIKKTVYWSTWIKSAVRLFLETGDTGIKSSLADGILHLPWKSF